MQFATIDPTFDLRTRYPSRLYMRGLRQCGMQSLTDTLILDQHQELNLRPCDIGCRTLSAQPLTPTNCLHKCDFSSSATWIYAWEVIAMFFLRAACKLKLSLREHSVSYVYMLTKSLDYIHFQHKKASNHHANLPLEMYSFTL